MRRICLFTALSSRLASSIAQTCVCCIPVGACSAELGMVALSRGTVLVSGSGVLVVGDAGTGLGTTRGFLCIQRQIYIIQHLSCLLVNYMVACNGDKVPMFANETSCYTET